MIKKCIRKWWFWSSVALILFCGNILYAIFAPESDLKASLLTTLSGWISGIATIVIGIIAALQSQKYNKDHEEQDRSVDLVVESMEIVSHGVPSNVLGQIYTTQSCNAHISILLFNVTDKPVFNIKAVELISHESNIKYDLHDVLKKDMYGKSFLIKNEKFYLNVGYIKESCIGECTLKITFKNQYGDTYEKNISFWLENNNCYHREIQEKTKLIYKEK